MRCWKSIYSGKKEDVREYSRGIDDISINKFKDNLGTNLATISQSLINNQYKLSPLKCIPIPKPNGKYRLVTSPTISDRIVHKAILSILSDLFYPVVNTGVSYCGVKKNIFSKKKTSTQNHISALKKLTSLVKKRLYWVYESDIEGFFDNVPKNALFEKIIKVLPDTSINTLIHQIIFFEIGNKDELNNKKYEGKLTKPKISHGLSQGSPLSPLFSNIYLSDVDEIMKTECGDSFIRYVDDFIIVADSEKRVNFLGSMASQELEKLSLNLAEDKTKIVNLKDGGKHIKFLGLKINDKKITAKEPGKIKSKFNNEYLNLNSKDIKNLKTQKDQIKRMNYKIQGCANYYSPFHSIQLMTELNGLILAKKKELKFNGLKIIDEVSTGHKYNFPSEDEWSNYFRSKS